jgi:hypothetical protein
MCEASVLPQSGVTFPDFEKVFNAEADELTTAEVMEAVDLAIVQATGFLSRTSRMADMTGSFVINEGSDDFKDVDFIVLVENLGDFQDVAAEFGYFVTSGDGYLHDAKFGNFSTLRRPIHPRLGKDINLIVTTDVPFYGRWVEATELAWQMVLKEKDQRVKLFQYVLYGYVEKLD